PGPEVVAERLDHMVRRDAEVGRAVLEQAQDRGEYAAHGAHLGAVRASAPRYREEVAKELVGAVDQMHLVRAGMARWEVTEGARGARGGHASQGTPASVS